MKVLTIAIIILVLLPLAGKAGIAPDTLLPTEGKPMPDFILDNVHHYKKTKVSPSDFKGKWLFMDFWFIGCTSCLKSFPKVNSFNEQLKDRMQFLLVGASGSDVFGKGIEAAYEKIRVRQNLNLAIAYDSVLNVQWNIRSMPHIIIIDPEGVVRVITDGRDITAEKLQKLINGENTSIYSKEKPRTVFDANGLDSEKVVFRSVIARFNGELPWIPHIDYYANNDTVPAITFSRIPLYGLYNLAYLGRYNWSTSEVDMYSTYYPTPIMEMEDTTVFSHDRRFATGAMYNYSLKLPLKHRTRENIMRAMQDDLRRTFGYDVTVEYRMMPVWTLVARPGAGEKLRTKTGVYSSSNRNPAGDMAGFTLKNIDMDYFLSHVRRFISDDEPPFFDETGILWNIDITMDCSMMDKNQVVKELQRNGLDLIKKTRSMKVVVIKDPTAQ